MKGKVSKGLLTALLVVGLLLTGVPMSAQDSAEIAETTATVREPGLLDTRRESASIRDDLMAATESDSIAFGISMEELTTEAYALQGYTVAIDPGHGGTHPGAVGPTGYQEKEATLDIGLRLRDLLVAGGANVVMTRETDVTVSLSARVDTANNAGADIFVSIHHNAFDGTVKGIETYYSQYLPSTSDAAHLATLLQNELIAEIDSPNRNVKTCNLSGPGYLYVLDPNNSQMPAALTETMFIDNSEEEAKLKDPAVRQRIAEAHFRAICEYFGVDHPADFEWYPGVWSEKDEYCPDEPFTNYAKFVNWGEESSYTIYFYLYNPGGELEAWGSDSSTLEKNYAVTWTVPISPPSGGWTVGDWEFGAEVIVDLGGNLAEDRCVNRVVSCNGAPAWFELHGWSVTPKEACPDETITVEGWVTNVGGATGSDWIDLHIVGVASYVGEEYVTLAPDESTKVVFTGTPQGWGITGPGLYTLRVHIYYQGCEWSDQLEVLPCLGPPEFKLSGWSVYPQMVEPGEIVDIEGYVQNVGGEAGWFVARLMVDGDVITNTPAMFLSPGSTEWVSFSHSEDAPGTYSITVDVMNADTESWDDSWSGGFEVVGDKLPPEVTTYPATDVTDTSATWHGYLESLGDYAAAGSAGEPARYSVIDEFESIGTELSEDMSVVGCPEDLDEMRPSRTVLQIIDNSFHKWKEYDVGDSGEFCIVMEAPGQRRLSAEEARQLLEASGRWVDEIIPPGTEEYTLDPADPRLNLPPVMPFIEEDYVPGTVIGDDDRERVPLETIQTYPWNTIGYISNTYPNDASYRGTGFLVAPYAILTNGHVVYNEDRGGYVESLQFSPAQFQSQEGASTTRPYGTRYAVGVTTNQEYIDAWQTEYNLEMAEHDYAAAFIDEPFTHITTYMPLLFDHSPSYINTAGYPMKVQDETNSLAQWYAHGEVVGVEPRILRHLADATGGQSGSPTWVYSAETGLRRVVALVSFSGVSSNGGPRLVAANQNLIEEWMQWAPTTIHVSFEWGTNEGGPYANETTPQTMSAPGPFSAGLTGLTPGITYYFRAKAVADGISVYGGELSFTTEQAEETGTIQVDSNLTGAQFSLQGPANYSGTTPWSETDAPVGTYTITWGEMTGYETPSPESKNLELDETIEFYGNYEVIEETGTIQVNSNLTDAPFNLEGPANYSGTTPWSETDAPVGTYTIIWGEMTGCETPSPESKSLEPEETIQFHGDYVGVVGPDWRVSMTARAVDEGSNPELEFGIHPDATDGYDSGIDLPAPPPQPGALFEAYFSIPDPTFNRLNKDFRGETPNQWTLNVKSTSQDIELSWSTDDVPEDLFLRLTGGDVDVDMSTAGSVTLPAGSHTVMILASDLAIVTAGLPGGRINREYDALLIAAGGMEPYTWAIVEGTLPDGLELDAATGVISGLPTAVGRFSFTVEVTDAVSGTADRNLQIVVVWSVPMVADAGTEGSNAYLEFGVHPDATDGYDSGIDLPAPPPDPGALFEAYFSIDDPTFSRLNKDFRGETPNQWTLKVKSTNQDIELTWDNTEIPAELCALMDTGTQKIDMKAQESLSLPAGEYTITISVSEQLEIHLDLKAGWNLVSVPVIPVDPSMAAVFAGTEVVYAWNAITKGYYVPTEVEAWRGYWVAVTSDTIITISGVPVHDWTAQMSAGWNLVGSLMSAVDFSSPDTDPPGKVEPFTYRWNPDLPGYDYSTTIEPKMGHWVAATEDCVLHLPPRA